MNIVCVYTVETYHSIDQPLSSATEIPFGISIIVTVLETAGHNVQLLVITPDTPLDQYVLPVINNFSPHLFCFTAVSTQYWQAKKIAEYVKNTDKNIFCLLGGHHASLNSEAVIAEQIFDALCVGEGESSVVNLANAIEYITKSANFNPNIWISDFISSQKNRCESANSSAIKFIGLNQENTQENVFSNLWFSDKKNGAIYKFKTEEFRGDLDSLPLINRKIWDRWTAHPGEYPAILLGRGCPFKCTYCSNHAMAKLSEGTYVRFRSPENIISELEYIQKNYPDTNRVYLEVETFGANRKASYAVFDALANHNKNLETPISYGINLALTSNFMDNEHRLHELLKKCTDANIKTINIGLESGSERMRKDVLLRPKYTNDELIRFCNTAKSYGIKIIYFVLMGLPGETLEDYKETVRVARESQPYTCYLSIFFPYLGTDLANVAIHMGLITPDNLSPTGERSNALLDLEGFSSRRIKLEYILFWWRVYYGHWPTLKVLATMFASYLRGHPRAYSFYLNVRNRSSFVMGLANKFSPTRSLSRSSVKFTVPQTIGTRIDVMRD